MPHALDHLPADKATLLQDLTARLARVDGVVAVVLGGSYAGGGYHAGSDLDVGIYYREEQPFAVSAIRAIADRFSVAGPATVTDFYAWGAWVNGGAWIRTVHGKVDFLYRNVDQIRRTVDQAEQGIAHRDYGQQPAYGFYSVIYLAETRICIPLHDPHGIIAQLKRRVARYPAALKERVVADSLWSVEFTLLHARGFAAQGDVYNTVGCLTRAAADLTQALFALNEVYFLRDKQVMATMAGFQLLPVGYGPALEAILAQPGLTPAALQESVDRLTALWQAVIALPGVAYVPKFQLG